MPGWSQGLFVSKPLTDCQICTDVPREAVIVHCCGISFCAGCFSNLKGACPNRCSPPAQVACTPNLGLRCMIQESMVYCSTRLDVTGTILTQEGCSWTGKLESLPMHLEECDQVLPCPFNARLQCGCPMVRRCDWNAHQGQMGCP